MYNGRGNRVAAEDQEERRPVLSGKKRSSYLDKRTRLLSDASSSSSHSSEPDPDSIAGMRLRGSLVPSPGGPRSGAPGAGGQDCGDFADEWSTKGVTKACEYVGSFSVAHLQPNNRAEFVRLQLQSLQNPKKSRPVSLFISLSGIKVYDPENHQVTLMAHALKRISYATCDPDFCQFAFLSRNPKGPVGIQYCHVFITREPSEAEEINAIVGKAFKVAYASLRSKKQFFELIEELNREQEEYFAQITHQQNVVTRVGSWIDGRERELVVGQGRVWAKQVAGRKQHKQPHIIAGIDPALQVTIPPPNHCRSPVNFSASSQSQRPSSSQAQMGASASRNARINSAESGDSAEEFEWVTEEDIEEGEVQPSAPTMEAEVAFKQTQRTVALPPAPYYEVEPCNEWTARSIALPTTGFSIIHEQKTKHLVLQKDQAAASSSGSSMALIETHRAHTPGQILLQDSTVPPPFTYKPNKEEDDCYGYGNGYSENRLSEYSDRDSFDYDRSYAILEQFINATCDISGDWLDPDLRPSPVSKEPSERPFDDVQSEGNSEQQDSVSINNNIKKLSDESSVSAPDSVNIPQPIPHRSMQQGDLSTDDVQGQRSSPPINNQSQRLSKLSCQEDQVAHLNGQAMNINQNANEEPGRDKPKPTPRKAKAPAPPIPVDAGKVGHGKGPAPPIPSADVNRLVNVDESSEKNNLKRSASSVSSSGGEAVSRALAAPKSLDIAGAAAVSQRLLKGQASTASQRSGGRSPGHVGHKVEVEIGKFRCKKVSNNGIAPPLPPRSTSLVENGMSQDGSSAHGNPIQYKDVTEAPWFKAGVPREIAVEILQQEERGAFIVRESKSHPGCFALSIKVDGDFNETGIANYLVVRTKNGGYTIKGFGRDFADLPRLVHHYALHQEQLPCKLNLSRCNPLFRQDEDEGEEEGDGDGDLDYTSRTDYKPVMAGMK
ncbi:uncharacterized protein LOC110978947 isoform X2 [Acanthaster planci]|uniref:Uncharacterized protein LOC110978947 isoform X2 n=1 Tax=Acanthaster planci TaxID=133434 RepID=A0A8B7YEF0_ACAPL|nr:uncharacterized protein LOC110978947 isoform X2 [Acanthaster planci]